MSRGATYTCKSFLVRVIEPAVSLSSAAGPGATVLEDVLHTTQRISYGPAPGRSGEYIASYSFFRKENRAHDNSVHHISLSSRYLPANLLGMSRPTFSAIILSHSKHANETYRKWSQYQAAVAPHYTRHSSLLFVAWVSPFRCDAEHHVLNLAIVSMETIGTNSCRSLPVN